MENVKDKKAQNAKAAEFNQRPEHLLLAIVYNNPDMVSQNLQSYAGVSYAQTPEQIMDWFEQNGGQLDADTLYNILDVPFNPDANNITADYQDVLESAIQSNGENDNDLSNYSWADIFPDAIQDMYNKYFAGQQSTGTIAEDIDEHNTQKQKSIEKQHQQIDKNKKRWKMGLMVLNGIVVLSVIAFVVFAAMALLKNTKLNPASK